MFRTRGRAILRALNERENEEAAFDANWFSPGEPGLDDLNVPGETESSLLAFSHLSEKAAARRFAVCQEVLALDPTTRDVFTDVLKDEAFHMNHTLTQLKRAELKKHGVRLWWARLKRLWKGYLRIANAVANLMGGIVLAVRYFLILPIFALLAKRAAKKELPGWVASHEFESLRSQYRSRGIARQEFSKNNSRNETESMKILGISAHYHDSAAALAIDGVPAFVVQEERLSHQKNDAAFREKRLGSPTNFGIERSPSSVPPREDVHAK